MDESDTNEQMEDQRGEGRWIVGVDGSDSSRHAAFWAVANAPGRASEVQLATSWSVPVSVASLPTDPLSAGASVDALEASAHAILDDLARSLSPPHDIQVTRNVGRGGAALHLLAAAQQGALLVVGSRGRGGFARLLLGSTSTQCATHSSTPVAVIPATAHVGSVTSIAVAFDGSNNSIAALTWAHGFAAPGSTIDCVSVWDTTPIAVGADQFFFPEASDLAEERFEHLVMRTVRPIGRDDVEVRHTFLEGQPRTVLAEFAATRDLLVVGARGHGAVGAAILGSTSTWLLHHATGPVVVVPRHADGAGGGDDVDSVTSDVPD